MGTLYPPFASGVWMQLQCLESLALHHCLVSQIPLQEGGTEAVLDSAVISGAATRSPMVALNAAISLKWCDFDDAAFHR
jgi:hypothetical protein